MIALLLTYLAQPHIVLTQSPTESDAEPIPIRVQVSLPASISPKAIKRVDGYQPNNLGQVKSKHIGQNSFEIELAEYTNSLCVEVIAGGYEPIFRWVPIPENTRVCLRVKIKPKAAHAIALGMPVGDAKGLRLDLSFDGSATSHSLGSLETLWFSRPAWDVFEGLVFAGSSTDVVLNSTVVLADRSFQADVIWGEPNIEYTLHSQVFGQEPVQVYRLPRQGNPAERATVHFSLQAAHSTSTQNQPKIICFYGARFEDKRQVWEGPIFATFNDDANVYVSDLPLGTYRFRGNNQCLWDRSGITYLNQIEPQPEVRIDAEQNFAKSPIVLDLPKDTAYVNIPEVWGLPTVPGAVFRVFDQKGVELMPQPHLLGPRSGYLKTAGSYCIQVETQSGRLVHTRKGLAIN